MKVVNCRNLSVECHVILGVPHDSVLGTFLFIVYIIIIIIIIINIIIVSIIIN